MRSSSRVLGGRPVSAPEGQLAGQSYGMSEAAGVAARRVANVSDEGTAERAGHGTGPQATVPAYSKHRAASVRGASNTGSGTRRR